MVSGVSVDALSLGWWPERLDEQWSDWWLACSKLWSRLVSGHGGRKVRSPMLNVGSCRAGFHPIDAENRKLACGLGT